MAARFGPVGAAGAGVAAATPVINAVGFTAAGISQGSLAAWLMSLGGGATQAGGVVATLQSVGVLGVLSSGPVVAIAAGTGVAIYYGARVVYNLIKNE